MHFSKQPKDMDLNEDHFVHPLVVVVSQQQHLVSTPHNQHNLFIQLFKTYYHDAFWPQETVLSRSTTVLPTDPLSLLLASLHAIETKRAQ